MKLRWLATLFAVGGGLNLVGPSLQRAIASPIIPEAGSPTQVVQSGNEFTITGGVTSGDGQALFHSFEQLGLSQEQIATFLAQPEVHSILGRVVGGDASYIDGLLQVSGTTADLYLINPAGILFGPNAQLDLSGSFAATTASGIQFEDGIFDAIAANDYSPLSGSPVGLVFTDVTGSIVNAADLGVMPGESIMLVGGQVISTGTLTTPGGEITIAAIPEAGVVRISHPDGVLSLELAALPAGTVRRDASVTPLSLPALLTGPNGTAATGLMVQPDGTVLLTNDGTAIPNQVGTAIASGSLNVSDSVGGSVTVVGDRVALLDATVNASGNHGGGLVRIGGDLQGSETLFSSRLTVVDADSAIAVDSTLLGNGGQAIVWSDEITAFYGDISTRGGTTGGDGGFIEVSGRQALTFRGDVDTTAVQGTTGTLLLDPENIVIRDGLLDGDDSDLDDSLLSETTIDSADLGPTEIYESELEGLAGSTDISLQASDTIIIDDLSDDALTFDTDSPNPGSITFIAGNEFRTLDTNDVIEAPMRSLTITANTITTGPLDTSEPNDMGGDVTLTAAGAIAVGDVITQGDAIGDGSGDVTITGGSVRTGRIDAGGGFLDDSRVELTATVDDVIVDTITAGGGGLEINAARRFQALETFDAFVRITLDSSTDAALIDFLTQGNPQPLIDAGLVDTTEQVLFTLPTSISVSPDSGGGAIVIRHGGAANTFNDGNISIEGTGNFPEIQFVAGPNDDHTIEIDASIPSANFVGFTPLFPSGMFPENASGATGAILRGQGDATLVTSFQNIPFVPGADMPEIDPPVVDPPVVDPPENPETPTMPPDIPSGGEMPDTGAETPPDTGGESSEVPSGDIPDSAGDDVPDSSGGEGTPDGGGGEDTSDDSGNAEAETSELDNLSDEDSEEPTNSSGAARSSYITDEREPQDCQSTISDRSPEAVEISTVCPLPNSE
ncbi:filamentous hemagglutinin N-terminal domain-containing protein [Oscillatoria sp. CS-180]|uniref:two-partner secretion domain-containing protein n=1 Tax=Oscillatoria sp. CS-180 TaxID=3021720 RepID=UPI00232EAAE8|nr:filamentous hemagglutinin N-terminal domain-containing protein [Oscillatoria sp. CS-180]MDB9528259.1 filamentous hemagglutinin N-terminal domain-containing protein [Oscillatoria sp. CS-180]